MGFTFVKMKVKKNYGSKRSVVERLLVDSCAIYSVIPEKDLKFLGVAPHSEEEFELANGDVVMRKVGDAHFEYRGKKGSAPVVFGKKGESKLLGILALEALGFMLDPLSREIKPLKKRLV